RIGNSHAATPSAIARRMIETDFNMGPFDYPASEDRFAPRPLVEHAHALADRQPYARPVLGRRPLEDAPRLVEPRAGEQQFDDAHAVFAPLLDLVEVTAVSLDWVVGLFVEDVIRVGHGGAE